MSGTKTFLRSFMTSDAGIDRTPLTHLESLESLAPKSSIRQTDRPKRGSEPVVRQAVERFGAPDRRPIGRDTVFAKRGGLHFPVESPSNLDKLDGGEVGYLLLA